MEHRGTPPTPWRSQACPAKLTNSAVNHVNYFEPIYKHVNVAHVCISEHLVSIWMERIAIWRSKTHLKAIATIYKVGTNTCSDTLPTILSFCEARKSDRELFRAAFSPRTDNEERLWARPTKVGSNRENGTSPRKERKNWSGIRPTGGRKENELSGSAESAPVWRRPYAYSSTGGRSVPSKNLSASSSPWISAWRRCTPMFALTFFSNF